MNRSAFRRFEFFDVDTITEDMTSVLGSVPTCAAAEGGMLIFGDNTGNIIISDRNFHISERKHKVFRGEVKGVCYLFDPSNHSRQYIIALGDDSKSKADFPNEDIGNSKLYLIKIFSANDMSRPLQVLNASAGESMLTAFSVLNDATQIAVGYDNGAVLLFQGMFLKESTQGRAAAPVPLLTRHKNQVTGLHFCELAISKNQERRIRLFAVFDNTDEGESTSQKPPEPSIMGEDPSVAGLLVFDTSCVMNASGTAYVPIARAGPKVLDERGASLKCSSLMKGTSELVVGRGEAVYNYSVEDRGGALAIFGEKLCVGSVGRYTLVVSVEEKSTTAATQATIGGVTPVTPVEKPRKPNVNIYDLKNKIICGTTKKYQLPVGEKVQFALHDGGCVYLITSSWSLIRFREKDTTRKLDMLLQNSKPPLYSLAIMLAAEEQVETAEIMKLYKLYGDHLYSKNEFDAAIVQYCHTIGYISPSYVVMKFLDPYRIGNLITYLEKLYDKGLSTKDHITLLLTCYTKIKDDAKIKEMLDGLAIQKISPKKSEAAAAAAAASGGASGAGSASDVVFDSAQAVATLNSSGYTDYALQIAAKYHQHQAYIGIQLAKTPPQYEDVLGYIAYLAFVSSPEDILAVLKKYGRLLLKARPKPFTALLIKLCTGDFAAILPQTTSSAPVPQPTKGAAGTTAATAAAAGSDLIRALSGLLGDNIQFPKSTIAAGDVLSLYCDDKDSLLVLLEGVEESSKGRMLSAKVSTTLMELYLHNYSVQKEKLKVMGKVREIEIALQVCENNVMRILDGAHTTYDTAHALLLVHSFGFEKGERLLLEKQHSIDVVMRMLIESNDSKEVFKVLRREGTKDAELYVQVLTYFVKQTMEVKATAHGRRGSTTGHGSVNVAGVVRERDSDDSGGEEEEEDLSDSDDEDDNENKWDSVIDVMELIEKESILSPIQVISILSLNPHLPLSIASNYISKSLKELTDDISQGEILLRGALEKLNGISHDAQLQQQARQSKAKQEKNQLRRHHHHGYDDEDSDEEQDEEVEEDIKQMEEKEQQRWHEIRKLQIACSLDHEAFYKELELSADGFNTVAGFFGRSIINA